MSKRDEQCRRDYGRFQLVQTAVEVGARLRAARALMGHENRKTFAAFLGMASFGEGPIRAVEQGKRVLRDQEIVLVAEKCGLPRTFFTAPRGELGPRGDAAASDELMAEIRGMREQLNALSIDRSAGLE